MDQTYSVMFFRGHEHFGYTPNLKDLNSAKNFAESTLLVNGADSFAIYFGGKHSVVFKREINAKKSCSQKKEVASH